VTSKASKDLEAQAPVTSQPAKEQTISSFFPKADQSQNDLSCSKGRRPAEIVQKVSTERENKLREFNESKKIVPEVSNTRKIIDDNSKAIMEEEFNKEFALLTGPNYPEAKREWSDRKDHFPRNNLLALNVKIDSAKVAENEASRNNLKPSSFPVNLNQKPAMEATSRSRIIPESHIGQRVSQLNSPVAKTTTLHDYMSSGSKKAQEKGGAKIMHESKREMNGRDLKRKKSEEGRPARELRPNNSPPINFPVPRPVSKSDKGTKPKMKGTKMQSQIPMGESGRGNSRSGGQTSLDAFISNGAKKEPPEGSKKHSKTRKDGNERGKEKQAAFVDVIRGEPQELTQGRKGASRGKGDPSAWGAIMGGKK
jgi:hypothetical protein